MDQVFFQRLDKGRAPGIKTHAIVDPGVVDQPVDAPEALQHAGDGCAAGVFVAQFDLHEQAARTALVQLLRQIIGQRAVAENHRDRAFVGQPQRDGRANPRAAAGDDKHLVLQMQIHCVAPSML